MQAKLLKGGLAAVGTIVTYYASNLTPLFFLMLFFEAADYLTGMAAAKWFPNTPEDGWNSKRAKQGFVKKIGYLFLVGVGWGADFIILEVNTLVDLPLAWGGYLGTFAMVYLMLTEAVSVTETFTKWGLMYRF